MNVNYKKMNTFDDGCRYCKQPGHIKRNCPKLANKTNNTRSQRDYDKPRHTPVVVIEEKDNLALENFPLLGSLQATNHTPAVQWTGVSFSAILTKHVDEEIFTDDKN